MPIYNKFATDWQKNSIKFQYHNIKTEYNSTNNKKTDELSTDAANNLTLVIQSKNEKSGF